MLVVNRVTSYFGASGGAEHPIVIVAGYLSTVGRWERFDTDWRKVLNRREFNVPYFHMKEFAHSTTAFRDWKGDERRRRRFINALISVIIRHCKAGFACAIESEVWDRMNTTYPLTELFGCAYALAGRDCVNKTHHWAENIHHYQRNEVRCVFEDGDKGKTDLLRVIGEAHKPLPIFESGDRPPRHSSITSSRFCRMGTAQGSHLRQSSRPFRTI